VGVATLWAPRAGCGDRYSSPRQRWQCPDRGSRSASGWSAAGVGELWGSARAVLVSGRLVRHLLTEHSGTDGLGLAACWGVRWRSWRFVGRPGPAAPSRVRRGCQPSRGRPGPGRPAEIWCCWCWRSVGRGRDAGAAEPRRTL